MYFLQPLIEWKILTVEKLFKECNYPGTYKHFHKVLRNLEKKGIIQGYRDFFSRKKYIHVTELGNDLIFKDGKIAPNHNSMLHDTKMAELAYELKHYELVKRLGIEHAQAVGGWKTRELVEHVYTDRPAHLTKDALKNIEDFMEEKENWPPKGPDFSLLKLIKQ